MDRITLVIFEQKRKQANLLGTMLAQLGMIPQAWKLLILRVESSLQYLLFFVTISYMMFANPASLYTTKIFPLVNNLGELGEEGKDRIQFNHVPVDGHRRLACTITAP